MLQAQQLEQQLAGSIVQFELASQGPLYGAEGLTDARYNSSHLMHRAIQAVVEHDRQLMQLRRQAQEARGYAQPV